MTRGRHALTDDDRAVYAEIGRRLRAARRHAGLTQRGLANLVGLSHVSVSAIECGTQGYGIPLFLSLADALGVEPGDLLDHITGNG